MNISHAHIRKGTKTTAIVMAVALAVYGLCAWNSVGYLHPDEHFQVIEFACHKLGMNSPRAMAWEYMERIRPTLQPVMAMGVIRLCSAAGLSDPFAQAFTMRCLSSLLLLFAMKAFADAAGHSLQRQHRILLLPLTLFFWLIPLISVRFSSETLSGAMLLLILAAITKHRRPVAWQLFGLGILCGLGFEFRYQLAFVLLGLAVWAVIYKRYAWRQWLMLLAGFLLVLCLAFLLDSWFYNAWTFAPYHYFNLNIVKHVAASFGVAPWYAYLILLLTLPTFIIGSIVTGSLIACVFRDHREPAVWAFLFFLVCHSLIAHKEPRFLFPVLPLLPLFMIWGYEAIAPWCNKHVVRCAAALLLLVNTGGLFAVLFKPAAYGKVAMMEFLDRKARTAGKLSVVVTEGSNPFFEAYLVPEFYETERISIVNISDHSSHGTGAVTVLLQGDSFNRALAKAMGKKEIYRSVPRWQDALNRFYQTYDPRQVLIAYQ